MNFLYLKKYNFYSSIIVAKPKRADDEDEVIVPKSSSLSDSYKSPSTKSRNGSLGPNYDKASSQVSRELEYLSQTLIF